MSTTTTTPPAPSASDVAAETALASLPAIVGMFAAGKLASLNATIQGEISTIEADAGSTLTKLQAELDAMETSSPLVTAALTAAKGVLTAMGLALPSEDALFGGLKAAANDILSSLKAS